MMPDLERLGRLLGGPALARLRARLRSRYELGNESGTVSLAQLGNAERAALCGLLGRPPGRGTSLRFDVAELDAVLRRGGVAASLREALEHIDGPIVNRAAVRYAANLEWGRIRALPSEPRLSVWLAQPRALGLLKRLCSMDPERAAALCEHAQCVLGALPRAPTTRSHLAAQLLGDAHALDSGRPVATVVSAALRYGRAEEEGDTEQDESDRALWAAFGILVNELARPALLLNLPGHDAVPGEPSYLSLRTLVRLDRAWRVSGWDVFVCENPNFLAIAADALGAQCAPLVCTDGMPAAAQRVLLTQLGEAGARLRYHGDYDWPELVSQMW